MLSKTLLLTSLVATSALAAPSNFSKRDIPSTGGKSIIDVIDYWRNAYNLNNLDWSDQLAANAQKTGDDNGGVTENHELNPGSYAQVITPGVDDAGACGRDFDGQTPFGLYYADLLCEVPSDPQLGGNCPKWTSDGGIDLSGGETGHHDILTDGSYKTIGCAFSRNPNAKQCDFFTGLWVCDLGF